MTDHPLTRAVAAEITEEMRRAAASAYEDMAQVTRPENHEKCLNAALSAALAVAPTGDDRPWEPLNEGDPLRVGDEVRQHDGGVTTTAVVGRVDADGDPWTTEGRFIGVLEYGTWYVRRAVQELPTEDGAVIIAADGWEFIEAEVAGQTFIAREAVVCQSDFGPANVLEGAWRRADTGARVGGQVSRVFITPGTWKVDDQ